MWSLPVSFGHDLSGAVLGRGKPPVRLLLGDDPLFDKECEVLELTLLARIHHPLMELLIGNPVIFGDLAETLAVRPCILHLFERYPEHRGLFLEHTGRRFSGIPASAEYGTVSGYGSGGERRERECREYPCETYRLSSFHDHMFIGGVMRGPASAFMQ